MWSRIWRSLEGCYLGFKQWLGSWKLRGRSWRIRSDICRHVLSIQNYYIYMIIYLDDGFMDGSYGLSLLELNSLDGTLLLLHQFLQPRQ